MGKKIRNITILLCICFLLFSALSVLLVAGHADHDCAGEHCEICALIARLDSALKLTWLAVTAIAVFFVLPRICERLSSARALSLYKTPVSLKVQMNN